MRFGERRVDLVVGTDGALYASLLPDDVELGVPAGGAYPALPVADHPQHAARRSSAGGALPDRDPSRDLDAAGARLQARLSACDLCPTRCGVDRAGGRRGPCGAAGEPARIASWGPTRGDEPWISTGRGTGTILFASCSLRCPFCQSGEASFEPGGPPADAATLAGLALDLEARGCGSLALVSGTHYVPAIASALALARRRGLSLSVVHKTHGWDDPGALAELDGLVDVYLPDVKHVSPELDELVGAPGYAFAAAAALAEMIRQVGPLVVDGAGRALRGVLVRHLVLPGRADEVQAVLELVRRTGGPDVPVHVMLGYRPAWRAAGELGRRLHAHEREQAHRAIAAAGLRFAFATG